MILLRSKIKGEKIVQYHMGQAFFTKLTQDWKFSQSSARIVGRFLFSMGGLLVDIEFI